MKKGTYIVNLNKQKEIPDCRCCMFIL